MFEFGYKYTEGRPWYRICSCHPTVGLVVLVVIKIFFHCSSSLFYNWLTTAHKVPWPSLCIKISLQIYNSNMYSALWHILRILRSSNLPNFQRLVPSFIYVTNIPCENITFYIFIISFNISAQTTIIYVKIYF